MSDDGLGTVAIMAATGKSKTGVWRWQDCFMAECGFHKVRDKDFRKSRTSWNAPLQ